MQSAVQRNQFGFVSGFIFAYLVFTTIVFFVIKLAGHEPKTYYHIMLLSGLILMTGKGIRWYLK